MKTETVRLRQRNGVISEGSAEVRRSSELNRTLLGGGLIAGGLVLGVASVFVPIWHFCGTWALPVLGITIGVWVIRTPGHIDRVRTTCPGCQADVDLPGGAIEKDMWRKCPRCELPLQVLLS